MEEGLVEMRVMGISYNPIDEGAYALILAELNGPYRVPVVIGAPEAQSIAVILERVVTPRPLTHDLFITVCENYEIALTTVEINKFENGIFSSRLTFNNAEGKQLQFDARTSDAIALAVRAGSRIYMKRDIMEQTGFILEKRGPGKGIASGHNSSGDAIKIEWTEDGDYFDMPKETASLSSTALEDASVETLEQLLADAVATEDYELAREIKRIIESKKNNTDNQS